MKLGPVTKLDKRNRTSKEIDHDFMSKNCDITTIFPIYDQFGAMRKPNSGRWSVKLTSSLTVIFYLNKTEN